MEFLTAHWLDIVTTVLGLAYILLEYKASIWMWLVGFLMQSLGIVLYYQKGLYADCGMEFYYLAMTIYGYWRWIRAVIPSRIRPSLRNVRTNPAASLFWKLTNMSFSPPISTIVQRITLWPRSTT